MRPARILAPLVDRVTFRRGVHALLGGAVLIPYVLLAVGFAQMFADPEMPVGPVAVLVAVTVVIATVPPFLPAIRGLEISAARSLLDVPLPEAEPRPSWLTRWRAATWYVLHLAAGGLVLLALLFCVPMAVVLVGQGLNAYDSSALDTNVPPFDQLDGIAAVAAGVAMVPAVGYVAAAVGAGLAAAAPALLGPSSVERIKALEEQARRLSERNRLARELHDSVGHALTVTTLQAAAADQAIGSDPEVARRAIRSIEETGRAAMADLDHVLGVLRDDSRGYRPDPAGVNRGGEERSLTSGAGRATPQRGIGDISALIEESRGAGLNVDADVAPESSEIPAAVSREAFRVVQEGLTNALRHAGTAPVTLRVRTRAAGVEIELANPLDRARAADADHERIGRGLRGMRERVELLGGELDAGADGDVWRVHARLPGTSAEWEAG